MVWLYELIIYSVPFLTAAIDVGLMWDEVAVDEEEASSTQIEADRLCALVATSHASPAESEEIRLYILNVRNVFLLDEDCEMHCHKCGRFEALHPALWFISSKVFREHLVNNALVWDVN